MQSLKVGKGRAPSLYLPEAVFAQHFVTPRSCLTTLELPPSPRPPPLQTQDVAPLEQQFKVPVDGSP